MYNAFYNNSSGKPLSARSVARPRAHPSARARIFMTHTHTLSCKSSLMIYYTGSNRAPHITIKPPSSLPVKQSITRRHSRPRKSITPHRILQKLVPIYNAKKKNSSTAHTNIISRASLSLSLLSFHLRRAQEEEETL